MNIFNVQRTTQHIDIDFDGQRLGTLYKCGHLCRARGGRVKCCVCHGHALHSTCSICLLSKEGMDADARWKTVLQSEADRLGVP